MLKAFGLLFGAAQANTYWKDPKYEASKLKTNLHHVPRPEGTDG
jgi:hypothetical protein